MVARAAAFLAGVIVALFAGAATGWLALLLVGAAGGLRRRPAHVAVIAFGLGGLLLCDWHLERILQRQVRAPQSVTAVACIDSAVRVAGNGLRFDARLYAGTSGVAARRVQLGWYRASRVPAPGECWYFSLRLLPPRGLVNFHGADSERRLFAARVDGRGQVRGATARRLSAAGGRALLLRGRLALAQRLRFLTGEHPHAGIPLALAVGLRDGLTAQHWRTFSATGSGHLMAISGLHVGLVAALGFAAGRALPARPGRRGLSQAWLVALAWAGAYAALAGFTLPTRRALIMLAVFAGAALTRRRYAAADVLALGLVLVLVLDPLAVLGPGLWLSFGAVAALLIGRETGRVRPLAVQTTVFVGLMPLVAGWTGTVSLLSPLANLVCIPLFSVAVIPLTLLATALASLAPGACATLLTAVLAVISPLLDWLQALATLTWALTYLPARPLWTVALALSGVALLVLRSSAATALALALCLPLLTGRPARLAEGAWRMTALDVGQGMAVLIETRDHAVLYDTGNAWRTTDAGAAVVVPQLRALDRPALDALIVSHADQDHAGGVHSLLAEVPVAQIYAGELLPVAGEVNMQACHRGISWRHNAVQFAFVHPEGGDAWHGNDASCVLRVQGPACSALLTGDIEALAEVSLLWSGVSLTTDVVVGQHHGSRTSSSRSFVAAAAPAYVVFATGYANRWGFPVEEVVTRWRRGGATTLDTAAHGALQLDCDPHTGLSAPRGARATRRGPWRLR